MIQNIGKIIKLFISQINISKRIKQENITLDKGGIKLDKFHNKNIERSILITSQESYNMMKNKNITVNYGQLGENILVDFNPYDLEIGTKIKIGQVVLEITQHCTICNSLKKINEYVPTLLKNDRGVFAKVISEGIIFKKDTISIID